MDLKSTAGTAGNDGWDLYKQMREAAAQSDSTPMRTLLARYLEGNPQAPSTLHSRVLSLALSFARKHPEDFNFPKFLEMWGFCSFRPEDYKPEEGQNGEQYPALFDRVVKQLVLTLDAPTFNQFRDNIDTDQVSAGDFLYKARRELFWDACKIARMKDPTPDDLQRLWRNFGFYRANLCAGGPTKYHSAIIELAADIMDGDNRWRFIPFFKSWSVSWFMDQDWTGTQMRDGRTATPLAQHVLQHLYSVIRSNPSRYGGQGRLAEYLDWFREGASKAPADDHWPVYRYAKLLLMKGDKAGAFEVLKCLAAVMSHTWFYWNDLAECASTVEGRTIMLCKAATMQRNESFLGPLHLALAECLAQTGNLPQAAIEIRKYLDNHENMGARYIKKYNDLLEAYPALACQIPNSTLRGDNRDLYQAWGSHAEGLVFTDIPWTPVVITTRWCREDGKERVALGSADGRRGFLPNNTFPLLAEKPVGSIVEARLRDAEQEGQNGERLFRVLEVREPEDTSAENLLVRRLSGTVKIISRDAPGQSFGFVDNCFVPKDLVASSGLSAGDHVNVVAVIQPGGKWLVVDVEKEKE
ncbi:MAG: hypothetical protein NC336_10345 [Clostridium sp.]|nr:hypothetical protein [Clostridium sp.]